MVALPNADYGMPPLDDGPLAAYIGNKLADDNKARGPRATSGGTRLRGSQALSCARKIAFESIGYPGDVELDTKTLTAFRYGHLAHDDLIQPALVECFGAEVEVGATWMPELSLSLWLDAVYEAPVKTAVEIKSMASYGFDVATGAKKNSREPAGPKAEHVVQSALGALAPDVGAERQHIIYLSKERGSIAEWIFGVDEPLPHLEGATPRELVTEELARMAGILGRLDDGLLPRRVIPGHGLVIDPPAKDSKGQPWLCRYCAFQPTCAGLSADVVPLSSLPIRTGEQ